MGRLDHRPHERLARWLRRDGRPLARVGNGRRRAARLVQRAHARGRGLALWAGRIRDHERLLADVRGRSRSDARHARIRAHLARHAADRLLLDARRGGRGQPGLVCGDPTEELARVRREFDLGDVEVAGATLAASFVRRGLVDVFKLVVHPVVLRGRERLLSPCPGEAHTAAPRRDSALRLGRPIPRLRNDGADAGRLGPAG